MTNSQICQKKTSVCGYEAIDVWSEKWSNKCGRPVQAAEPLCFNKLTSEVCPVLQVRWLLGRINTLLPSFFSRKFVSFFPALIRCHRKWIEEVIFKKRIEPIGYSLGSKGEGWPRPYLPTRDHDNQSQAGSDPVVSLTRGPDGAMGGSSWWSVWTQNLKHSHLATEAEQKGQRTQVLPVEVGYRGSVGMSTTSLLKGIGVKGQVLWQAVTGRG